MKHKNPTRDFVEMMLSGTTKPLWICKLPNDKGSPGQRTLRSRDVEDIVQFCTKHDEPGFAIYYCVSSIDGTARNLETVSETPILWADIDYKNVVETPEEILKRVRKLPLPPSRIHATGNGLHLIWELTEPYKGDPGPTLRRLADVLSGDRAVCHAAALLRMPGTHNSKDGAWKLVRVL